MNTWSKGKPKQYIYIVLFDIQAIQSQITKVIVLCKFKNMPFLREQTVSATHYFSIKICVGYTCSALADTKFLFSGRNTMH